MYKNSIDLALTPPPLPHVRHVSVCYFSNSDEFSRLSILIFSKYISSLAHLLAPCWLHFSLQPQQIIATSSFKILGTPSFPA